MKEKSTLKYNLKNKEVKNVQERKRKARENVKVRRSKREVKGEIRKWMKEEKAHKNTTL